MTTLPGAWSWIAPSGWCRGPSGGVVLLSAVLVVEPAYALLVLFRHEHAGGGTGGSRQGTETAVATPEEAPAERATDPVDAAAVSAPTAVENGHGPGPGSGGGGDPGGHDAVSSATGSPREERP